MLERLANESMCEVLVADERHLPIDHRDLHLYHDTSSNPLLHKTHRRRAVEAVDHGQLGAQHRNELRVILPHVVHVEPEHTQWLHCPPLSSTVLHCPDGVSLMQAPRRATWAPVGLGSGASPTPGAFVL